MAFDEDWVPKTRLGKLVMEGQVASMEEAIKSGLPIREPQIIDMLLPDLEGVDTVDEQVAIALKKAGLSEREKHFEMERFEVVRHF